MTVDGLIPILNVSDLQASFAWFEKLGWRKLWEYGDPPDFGAVGSGGCEIFLCEGCQGSRDGGEAAGSWMSWFVSSGDAVDAAFATARQHDVTVTCEPTDMPWGVRECHVRHPDGHTFRIGAGIEHENVDVPTQVREAGPPLVIERVAVPVRLEKRLATLLADLATHKGMTVAECLEETLLHTFERVGGGVASPHTSTTLEHIRALKDKHGLDYDCHASYRFVER